MKIIFMNSFKALVLIILIFLNNTIFAQESVKSGKIKSVTEVAIELRGGKESEIKKMFQSYDEFGNLLEEIDYDDAGKIQTHTVSEFNDKNQKVKETSLLPDGKTDSVAIFTYDEAGNRISKTTFNRDGTIKSKKAFHYEYR